MTREAERERELDLEPDVAAPPTTVRRSCPVCRQLRVTKVCDPCGVDVDTGDLVQAPAPRVPPAALARSGPAGPAPEVPAAAWSARDVLAGLRRAPFGALVVAWLVASLQWIGGSLAFVPVATGGALPDAGGPLQLPARVVALFLVAYVLVARARGAARGTHAFDLEELGGVMLRALLVLGGLAPALLGPKAGPLVAALAPLPLGAVASERPLADLAPAALARAASRGAGDLARATLWSALALGPALAALHVTDSMALWRPVVVVVGASLAGIAAGLARRAAELRASAAP